MAGKADMTPLTEEQKERASRFPACRIPFAAALAVARGDQRRYERLLGFALDAYLNCARRFEPGLNRDGESAWRPYAQHWTAVSLRSKEAQWLDRKKRRLMPACASLDACQEGDSQGFAETLEDRGKDGTPRDPFAALEAADFAGWAMGRLKGRRKAVVAFRMAGWTLERIGRLMGVERERVRQIEEEAHAFLRRAAGKRPRQGAAGDFARLESWMANAWTRPRRAAEAKRKRKAAEAASGRKAARLALGLVPASGWFVADPVRKELRGPHASRQEAEAALPPCPGGPFPTARAETFARKGALLPYAACNGLARRLGAKGWKAFPAEG